MSRRNLFTRNPYDWWKTNVIYQIYPRSFYDSNGDGIGDLKVALFFEGIIEKLDYLLWLGIKAVWINPVYESPMADFGYDISDYKAISRIFGNMDDLKHLIERMHSKGMYLIMDFVPNHTSNRHPWFLASVKRVAPYTDYYVWRNGALNKETGKMSEPTNWISCFGGPSWTWCPERQQYYLHSFLPDQPNLNYKNAKVRQEMKEILQFWMQLGVDGFRIDAVNFIMHDEKFRNNVKGETRHDVDLPEMFDVIKEWTSLTRKFGSEHRKHIFIVTEAYTNLQNMPSYYEAGVDFPFNFALISWDKNCKGEKLKRMINDWMKILPKNCWSNWVIGNHDQSRIASKLGGPDFIDVANMLLLLLPGTATCYYGDELGLTDILVSFEECCDPAGKKLGPEEYHKATRDPSRMPVPWNDQAPNAGFTSAEKPWLPIPKKYLELCVAKQMENRSSHLHFFRQLLKLRRRPTFSYRSDNLRFLSDSSLNDKNVLIFVRELENFPTYLILINLNQPGEQKSPAKINIASSSDWKHAKIVARTPSLVNRKIQNSLPSNEINLDDIHLNAAEGLVLEVAESKKRKRHASTND